MSKLKTDPGLWEDFTPIAFHVDYWDYIGWSDKFAKSEFGDRQRRYADEGGSRFVYTPGMFRNGSEWNGWRRDVSAAGEKAEGGSLKLLIDGSNVVARYNNPYRHKELHLHIAILGMNLETRVKAGENRGETLRHDFVALDVISTPLEASSDGFRATTQISEAGDDAEQRAIVAWVSTDDVQTPIQSVGGFLNPVRQVRP